MFHSIAKYIFIFFYPFFYLFCFPFLVFLFDSLSFRVISTYLLLFLFCLLCFAVEFLSFLPSYFPLPFKQFFLNISFPSFFISFPFVISSSTCLSYHFLLFPSIAPLPLTLPPFPFFFLLFPLSFPLSLSSSLPSSPLPSFYSL